MATLAVKTISEESQLNSEIGWEHDGQFKKKGGKESPISNILNKLQVKKEPQWGKGIIDNEIKRTRHRNFTTQSQLKKKLVSQHHHKIGGQSPHKQKGRRFALKPQGEILYQKFQPCQSPLEETKEMSNQQHRDHVRRNV